MRTNQHSIAQDHLPPGLCESGKHDDWDRAYDKWLERRGFHDELRRNKAGLNGARAAKKRDFTPDEP